MTPKEKVEHLFQFYLPFVSSIGSTDDIKYRCQQCALIAVDEILNFMENDDKESDVCYWANSPTLNYWYEVKQEIEKL